MFVLISSQDHSVSTVSKAVADRQQAGTDSTTGTAGHNQEWQHSPATPAKLQPPKPQRQLRGCPRSAAHTMFAGVLIQGCVHGNAVDRSPFPQPGLRLFNTAHIQVYIQVWVHSWKHTQLMRHSKPVPLLPARLPREALKSTLPWLCHASSLCFWGRF